MENCNDIYGIKPMQEKVIEALKFLDSVCRENGFRYYLAYGTLLGAIRHKGFIPWDDDIDVWMPRDDYMKLMEYLRNKNKNERFVINEGEYRPKGDRPSEFQMRILDLNTKISREYSGYTAEVYAWIDIFALDTAPDDEKLKNRYLKNVNKSLFLYKVVSCKDRLVVQKSFFGMMNKIIFTLHNKLKLFFFLNTNKAINKVYKNLTKYEGTKTDEYFCYAAVYLSRPEKCFFATEWFDEADEADFEGTKFFVPKDWHNVLTTLYNDYMQLPPEEQRRPTHDVNIIE